MDDLDLASMTRAQKFALLKLLDEKHERVEISTAKDDLIQFARSVYPGYSVGVHHKHMARIFKDVIDGKKSRVIVTLPPRFGKSELTSYLFPAWFLGQKPDSQIIMATHTSTLSEDFGRRVRNLLSSKEYNKIFPNTLLSEDSKSAGSWNTSVGGKYLAVGVGGALAGRGANLLVIDDAHSEQDIQSGTKTVFDKVWSWYQTGPRQRLMWDAAVIVVMTRWGSLDLVSKLLEYAAHNPDADQWEVIDFPAILNEHTDHEKSLWPEKWKLEALQKTRATIEPRYWSAQYQQNPTADESAIIKREWWREWEEEDPPEVQLVIQTWDTAFEKNNTADYSACTTWGVFNDTITEGPDAGKTTPALILLDAFKDRMEFPELKKVALEHYNNWKPDCFLIEKKASGAPLIYELRAMGIPVQEYTPSRGNDKLTRVNAIADLFRGGKVWAPPVRWAKEVMEEMAAFPNGQYDDLVDASVLALMRFRQGGFVPIDSDWREEPKMFKSSRHAGYY